MSLVYYGGGNEDALKHGCSTFRRPRSSPKRTASKSPCRPAAPADQRRSNRSPHRHSETGHTPVTLKIKRNGPVAVCITSARDNIESEMLTRLMTSDADESREQTMAVVKGLSSKMRSDETES